MYRLVGEIESNLKELKPDMGTEEAINYFRNIFIDAWKFNYVDEIIPEDMLNEFVAQNTDMIKIIAKTNPPEGESFYVVYAKSKSDTIKYRQRLVKDLLDFTYSVGLEFANFLIILDYSKYWKLVVPIYRRELENAKLNIYVIDPEEGKFRTLVKNLASVAQELEEFYKKSKKHPPAIQIKALIDEYMHVRPLTEEFFKEYKEYYSKLKDSIKKRYGKKLGESYVGELQKEIFVERAAKTFAHTFLNRLMFVYFLQKKGWIVEKPALRKDLQESVDVKNFVRWLYEQWVEYGGEFYKDYLRILFLYAMNTPRVGYARRDIKEIQAIPSPIVRDVFTYGIPYFNGGLFNHVTIEGIDLDEIITSLPDNVVKELIFDFFEEYSFTVTEDTPYEVEVAVDPAMLGRIYESLITAEEQAGSEEEERRASGIFYTPRSEVDFMCRMAIYEYLKKNTKVDDVLLREFVFTPLHEWEGRSLPRELLSALESVKIVDPAAGSGAFLVGMFHLLTELYEKARVKVDYERKLAIIRENIYGVDIKEWAIRVAKLRLWLALIEKEEESPNEPILPNLETKLAVGDSLVPPHFVLRINGKKRIIEIPLAKFRESLKLLWAKKGAGEAIVHYKDLVRKYFMGEKIDGKPVKLKDIEEAKWGALQEFLETALEEDLKAKEKKEIKLLLEAVSKQDYSALEKPPFIWELDFPDVMLEKKGFDIVIANPPYVRQEKIYPEYYDLAEFQMLPKKEQDRLKKEYKEKIIEHMKTIIKEKFEHEMKLNKRSDLYVYFFIQGVNLLNPKGALVFITSNSWLDVDYGTSLQEFFLRFTNLKRIIDYTTRSFEQADVNTVITVLTRKPKELFNTVDEGCVNFVLLKRSFDELSREIIEKMLECYAGKVKEVEVFGGKVYSYEDDDIRVRSVKAVELAKMGGLEIGTKNLLLGSYNVFGEYKGMKWGGILIRAPRIFYVILDKGKDKLVRLERIADVTRGFTTGANEFFYLEPIRNPVEWPVCKICGRVHEPGEGLVAVKNKAGWEGYIEGEFLKPLIKSPKDLKHLIVKREDLTMMVFMCDISPTNLENEYFHAFNYVQWGESNKYHLRPTVRGRKYWYSLPELRPPQILIRQFFNHKFDSPYNPNYYPTDHTFYYLTSIPQEQEEVIAAILNSTITALLIELLGRKNMGEGVLTLYGPEWRNLLVVDANLLNSIQHRRLVQAFEQMANREIKSIFEELGLPKPNRDFSNINPEDVSLDKVLPDRRELDRVIFEALGLTEEEQLEVYRAVVELVKARLVKAKTFSKRR
ncbi:MULTISPECIES: Eco57I restriction-modification methylase domain-containing protein [Thermococcus]|uniref:Eco57I restriction-modification methylase domain-containing protein n=1 Tax=Thermococcus TaxID=2263 RepID=UPI000B354496|nr:MULTISPECIES: DNA methyltransferase [Thermococcus]MCA6212800.1 N-6 DNA methylase [Thermococcus bergensis]